MTYFDEKDRKLRLDLDRILLEMPPFCRMYFFGREQKLAVKTLHNTSFTIRDFFNFIAPSKFQKRPIDLSIIDLGKITTHDIENYMAQLADTCASGTVGQSVYTLNSFFRYYYRLDEIPSNPVDRVEPPARKEKPIIRLTQEETKRLLNAVDSGYRSGSKKKLGEKWVLRNKTILIFFLSTGIRLSELVGLDYGDIDLDNACFQVRRKGGRREMCYMTNELVQQLQKYLLTFPKGKPTDPLFESLYGGRINKTSIQTMVRKYCQRAGINKHITPHKLRSTFGTNMYEKTRDIYLVAELLGHKSVNTTTKHYTTVKDELKRKALDNFNVGE
ncbi:MAG: tyrosine-type recombinase/integrase [Prevotella sp.]|nr:tyrosine-type recombinase/integrase [Prevotella sp.]